MARGRSKGWWALVFVLAAAPAWSDWRDSFVQATLSAAKKPEPATAAGRRYVLISGLFTDLTGGSYAATQETLLEAGVPPEDIVSLTVSSSEGLVTNCAKTHRRITEALEKGPQRPTVFVGHSLGAVSLWCAALMDPDYYSRVGNRFIFIQGPFQGSPLAQGADYLSQSAGESVTEWTGWSGMLARGASSALSAAASAVTGKLLPTAMVADLKQIQRSSLPRAKAALSDRLLFLATTFSPTDGLTGDLTGLGISACALGMQLWGAEGDSVVPLESQMPKGLPKEMRRVLAGYHHFSFTGTDPAGRSLAAALLRLP
jgi:pimeloyl-ACP methyl ester carboxylesterase